MSKLSEMLAARQPPGAVFRRPVRYMRVEDAQGNETPIIDCGEHDTSTIEGTIIKLAEEDGLDTSTMEVAEIDYHDEEKLDVFGAKHTPESLARLSERPDAFPMQYSPGTIEDRVQERERNEERRQEAIRKGDIPPGGVIA